MKTIQALIPLLPLLQTLLWIAFSLIIIIIFKKELSTIITTLEKSIKESKNLKIGPIEISDIKVNITELNHKISQLNDNIYEIFLLSMGPNMYNNLRKISSENFGSYKNLKNNSGLERELYYLRDIGYIEVPQIRELPEKGNNLSDYVKITELGKQFVFYRENYLKLKFKDLR